VFLEEKVVDHQRVDARAVEAPHRIARAHHQGLTKKIEDVLTRMRDSLGLTIPLPGLPIQNAVAEVHSDCLAMFGRSAFISRHGYNSHEGESQPMRSVNVAELKNHLSKYLTFAKSGEEIVIRDRNLPVAKLIPFSPEAAGDEELLLVAAGKLRIPEAPVKVDELLKIPTGSVDSSTGIQALLNDRQEGL
jgi:prevent-host-death family protein